MSTYYYFHCKAHRQSGGNFTRQAWGYGNADLIDTFKFVMYHVAECGPESIGVHSEYDSTGYESTAHGDIRRAFLVATADIRYRYVTDWTTDE